MKSEMTNLYKILFKISTWKKRLKKLRHTPLEGSVTNRLKEIGIHVLTGLICLRTETNGGVLVDTAMKLRVI